MLIPVYYIHMVNSPEQSTSFATPEEELAYLRQQIAEKERLLQERGSGTSTDVEKLTRAEITREVVSAHHEHPSPHAPRVPSLREEELEGLVLDLPADEDDEAVGELLQIVHEKGISNALSVVARYSNPHLEDDFHRALVQYIHEGYPAVGFKEGSEMWEVVHMTLYEVSMPAHEKEGQSKGLKELVSAMEQFYLGMLSIANEKTLGKRHFTIEVAVTAETEDIIFYCAVPTDKKALFEKHLVSLFPEAQLHEQKTDYNIFVKDGATRIASARLKEDAILALRTYDEFDHDPLNVLISVFSKLAKRGEGAAIQLVIRPVGDRYVSRYKKVIEKMEKGKKLKEALRDVPEGWGGELMGFAREVFKGSNQPNKEHEEPPVVNQSQIESARSKIDTPIVAVNVRIAVSTLAEHRAESVLSEIMSSFNQFEDTKGNSITFSRSSQKRNPEAMRAFTFRTFSMAETLPLSIREVTTLMHFPAPGSVHSSPEFKQSKAKRVPAPLGLPQDGTLLGINEYRGKETRAYLTHKDRVRHMYVIGQTGTGKSVFLQNMCVQDIEQGHGVCFIDPHGSDVQDILAAIPEHRLDDVIYFDPGYTERVMPLNMLEFDQTKPEQKTFVINELFGIFKRLYAHSPESMGPAFEQYFRNATALVIEDPASGNTMLDISRVLADEAYRNFKLARSKNPVVNMFWREIAGKAGGDASLANMVPYITNKFDVFTANDIMRPIIAQPVSAFNFRDLMDNRKILLVNLSKGKLGDMNANLIGLILVGKILMAALSRVDMIGEKPPFYLYIDEFQNVTTDSISSILSEARKYALGLTVAHQFISQLEEGIRDAVFGNVGSMAAFRVGSEDAEFLERQFAPVFESRDIMNIENYNCYLRLLAGGIPQTPFNIQTAPPPHGTPETAEYLKQRSYMTYGKDRAVIEEMINKRY